MRIFLAILALFITMTTAYAQEEIQTMEQNTPYVPTTLRLIYPQWQGGIVSGWMPDIPEEDSSRGYFLGAHLLNFLAPQNPSQKISKNHRSSDIDRIYGKKTRKRDD